MEEMTSSLGNFKSKTCSLLSNREKLSKILANLKLKMKVLVNANTLRMRFCKYRRRSDFFMKIGMHTWGSRKRRRSRWRASCYGLSVSQGSWFSPISKGNWLETPGRGRSEPLLLERMLMTVMASASWWRWRLHSNWLNRRKKIIVRRNDKRKPKNSRSSQMWPRTRTHTCAPNRWWTEESTRSAGGSIRVWGWVHLSLIHQEWRRPLP